MAVGINVPAGVTDWVEYLTTTWVNSYDYRGHGAFSSAGAVSNSYGQWVAGNAGTSESGVLLSGDFSYGGRGGFSGTITSLNFGDDLSGDASGYSLDTVLTLDLSNATTTTAFTYAIYYLSNQANLSYLWTYLGEQGTTQTGNSGGDGEFLYSFSGNDTLTGNDATDFDTFVYRADLNSGGWGSDTIMDFVDGNDLIRFSGYGWSDYDDFINAGAVVSGDTVTYGSSVITLSNFTGTLDADDFEFIA